MDFFIYWGTLFKIKQFKVILLSRWEMDSRHIEKTSPSHLLCSTYCPWACGQVFFLLTAAGRYSFYTEIMLIKYTGVLWNAPTVSTDYPSGPYSTNLRFPIRHLPGDFLPNIGPRVEAFSLAHYWYSIYFCW